MGFLMAARYLFIGRWAAWAVALLCSAAALAQEGRAPAPDTATDPGVARGAVARRAAPLQTYVVEVTDGVFQPKRLEVPAQTRFKIELVNHGPGPLEFENDEMNIEKVLGAGARSFLVLPPLAPGKHEFVDEFNPVTGVLEIHAR